MLAQLVVQYDYLNYLMQVKFWAWRNSPDMLKIIIQKERKKALILWDLLKR